MKLGTLDAPQRRPVEILLVDDSPSDRLITTTALSQAKLRNSVHMVGNGVDALAFLRREGAFGAAPRPDLVLLDLNMPRMDGRELLALIKADPQLKHIPVVVLTTSASPDDITAAYAAHANSYITKPVDFQRFNTALQALEQYWFEVVALPPVLEPPRGPINPTVVAPREQSNAMQLLLVEDSPTDALMLSAALERTRLGPVEIEHVTRLSDARAALAARRFAAVITDLSLPDATGLTALGQLRGLVSGEPIIVLTGNASDSLGEQAMEQGADDYLSKADLSGPALARAIQFAIHRRDVREERHQRQRVESVGRLAAGVAHDFNNLLTAIAGSAELILSGDSPEDAAHMLRDIVATADRGRTLTRQLLAFGRRGRLEPKVVLINEIVSNVTELMRRLIRPIVSVEMRLAVGAPRVRVDVHHIEQVLVNLGMNASDAMPSGGTLTLSTELVTLNAESASAIRQGLAPGRYVLLVVRDVGEGIPEEVMRHIFEPFFTTKEEGIGTGLGLASVREILEQHAGGITVESQIGRGTAFGIYLPLAEDVANIPTPAPPVASAPLPPAAPAAAPVVTPAAVHAETASGADGGTTATAPETGPSGATVLLAEDDPLIRNVIERILRRHRHTVLSADSAAGALALWREQQASIDLVITDLMMPGSMTALDLISTVQVERADVPVICCSGYSAALTEMAGVLREGENFLQKPFRVEQFEAIVARALTKSRLPVF